MHQIDICCCLCFCEHDNVKELDILHGVMLHKLNVPKAMAIPGNEGHKLLTLVLAGSPLAGTWPRGGPLQWPQHMRVVLQELVPVQPGLLL